MEIRVADRHVEELERPSLLLKKILDAGVSVDIPPIGRAVLPDPFEPQLEISHLGGGGLVGERGGRDHHEGEDGEDDAQQALGLHLSLSFSLFWSALCQAGFIIISSNVGVPWRAGRPFVCCE